MNTVTIDTSGFRSWFHRASEEAVSNVRQVFGQGVALAHQHARSTQKFQDRTGELRRSIVRGQKSTWVHFLKATAKHAAYVEYPTKPHRIEPRKAKVLRFMHHGAIRFSRGVNHPGTKGTHFMDDAATVGARFLDYRMEDAITRAFR
jgi:hypothetical protein